MTRCPSSSTRPDAPRLAPTLRLLGVEREAPLGDAEELEEAVDVRAAVGDERLQGARRQADRRRRDAGRRIRLVEMAVHRAAHLQADLGLDHLGVGCHGDAVELAAAAAARIEHAQRVAAERQQAEAEGALGVRGDGVEGTAVAPQGHLHRGYRQVVDRARHPADDLAGGFEGDQRATPPPLRRRGDARPAAEPARGSAPWRTPRRGR